MESRAPKKNNDLAEREAEATEKETLKDLEESFGSSDDAKQPDNKKVPSPDGSFDEGKELEQADPM
jgi:hypothetical protein